MRDITFELCAETLQACKAARDGGADRIELCSGLAEGGLTPSHGLIREAVARYGLPVHVLVRPRGGNFVYSRADLAVMAADIDHVKRLGAAGVVFGALNPDGKVAAQSLHPLLERAAPLQTTFHRAFDAAASLPEALETIIALGFDRILTSGGAPDVTAGADTLTKLVAQASGRIEIALGGGLTLENATNLARLTGAKHFHGSLRHTAQDIDAATVRTMVQRLQSA